MPTLSRVILIYMTFDAKKIEKKLRMAEGLFNMAMAVKKNQLKLKHPELSDKEVQLQAYAIIEKGCSR
jgi:hypothetical protein